MLRRLSLKLILSLTIIIVLITSVTGYIHVHLHKRQLVDTMILGADQLSRGITSATWHAMLDDHREAAYDIMRVIADKQGIDRIRMFNREGELTFSTDRNELVRHADIRSEHCSPCHAVWPPTVQLDPPSRVRIGSSSEGHRTLSMVTPIYNEAACSNAACHAHPESIKVLGVVDLSLRLDPVYEEERSNTMHVALSTIFQIAVAALFIIYFTRRFVALPIQDLIAGTKAVSAMKLDKTIVIRNRSQELDELADSFNIMRERLREAMNRINLFTQELESKVSERTGQLESAHQKLLHSDRMASLGQLAASVAHEINNPLAGVLNLSMLMRRLMAEGNVPPGREEEFRRYLDQICNETSRAGRIVSDLLAFSRRSKPQRSPADLNRIIRTTVSLVDHRLRLNDAEAVLDLGEDLPPIECDASQIQQVVLNLVLNAAEALHAVPGRHVTVTTRLAASGEAVELVVKDNGEGIPPENLTRIFDPFFTTKPEGKGVGLGLAVMYGIVKSHEGEIEVESEPGLGTVFTITLPLKPNGREPDAGAIFHSHAGRHV